jgi:hypothetical protein
MKAAVADCGQVDASLLRAGRGKCEADVHGDKMQTWYSLERTSTRRRFRVCSTASRPRFRALFRPGALSRDGPRVAAREGLRPLGPIRVDSHRPRKANSWRSSGRLREASEWAEVSRKTETVDVARVRKAMLGSFRRPTSNRARTPLRRRSRKLRALLAAPQPTPGIR